MELVAYSADRRRRWWAAGAAEERDRMAAAAARVEALLMVVDEGEREREMEIVFFALFFQRVLGFGWGLTDMALPGPWLCFYF